MAATKPLTNTKPITRTALRKLIDQLPESELVAAHRYLRYLRDEGDPVLQALLNAPIDDEPETEEERRAVEEAKEDIRAGRVVSLEEIKKEFGL
ncbi:MAG: hypothetical protein HYU30_00325 [Chloroflexi bacterium]|nr:hypothetical protein [Chloroflexota bacterium]MBI4198267.1 hypothetical protein [Chloroflexota bacterium]